MFSRCRLDDVDAWKKALKETGAVVIEGILSTEEVKAAVHKFWVDVKTRVPNIEPDDASTWTDENWAVISAGWENGFVPGEGLVSAPSAWDLRSHRNLVKFFSDYWDCDEEALIASVDMWIAARNWKHKPEREPCYEGLHCDQNPGETFKEACGFLGLQGMLLLRKVDASTGGLQLCPEDPEITQSNMRMIPEFKCKSFWCPLEQHQHRRRRSELLCDLEASYREKATLVVAEAGDFIVWDSRILHGGCLPSQELPDDEGLIRHTFNITMAPSCTIAPGNPKLRSAWLTRRKKKTLKGYCYNHWIREWGEQHGVPKPSDFVHPELTRAQLMLLWGSPSSEVEKVQQELFESEGERKC